MSINQISNFIFPASQPTGPDSASNRAASRTAQSGGAAHAVNEKKAPSAEEHPVEETKQAIDAGLELRVGVLPNSNVILVRFVDSNTGKVVREFPPEKLAEALAEIRARAAAHFDRKA